MLSFYLRADEIVFPLLPRFALLDDPSLKRTPVYPHASARIDASFCDWHRESIFAMDLGTIQSDLSWGDKLIM